MPRPGGQCFADMRDAGVWSSPIEPDSLHTGSETVFPKFVVLSSINDLGHVGVLHWKDDVAVGRASGPKLRAGHEGNCAGEQMKQVRQEERGKRDGEPPGPLL